MGKFVVKKTNTGIKFDYKAGNGETIGTSEVFKSKSSCLASIASVKKNAPIAAIEDQTVEGFKKEKNPKFVIYTDKSGAPRFKLQAKNGQNILACGEPFSDVKAVKNSIKSVIRNIESPIVEKDK